MKHQQEYVYFLTRVSHGNSLNSALRSALCTPFPGKPQAMTLWSIIMLRLL